MESETIISLAGLYLFLMPAASAYIITSSSWLCSKNGLMTAAAIMAWPVTVPWVLARKVLSRETWSGNKAHVSNT